MTALVLATLLNLSPGIRLADDVRPRNVALSEARFPLQFVVDEAPPPPPPPPLQEGDPARKTLDTMTREEVAAQLRRMDDTKPSLGGPITLIAVGAPLATVGALIALVGADIGAVAVLAVGAVMISVGALMIGAGIFFIVMKNPEMKVWNAERDRYEARLRQLGSGAAPPPAANDDQPPGPPPPPPPGGDDQPPGPPPPPPPPQASFVNPSVMQTVFVF